jgi:hypothetical protein
VLTVPENVSAPARHGPALATCSLRHGEQVFIARARFGSAIVRSFVSLGNTPPDRNQADK